HLSRNSVDVKKFSRATGEQHGTEIRSRPAIEITRTRIRRLDVKLSIAARNGASFAASGG
ncbi:MAG TPA: hypothetical protein VMY37_39125, partial [Thermoguttaceae bacterium]|nr:hypothetical protein [Thermoguttaceae bacterium]